MIFKNQGRIVFGVTSGRSHHASADDGSGWSKPDPGRQTRNMWTGYSQMKEPLTTGEGDPTSGRKRTVANNVGIM